MNYVLIIPIHDLKHDLMNKDIVQLLQWHKKKDLVDCIQFCVLIKTLVIVDYKSKIKGNRIILRSKFYVL